MKIAKIGVMLLVAVTLLTTSVHADVIISEVVDGNRIATDGTAGASPDPFLAFMEFTNTSASAASLDGLHFINFNNGNDSAGFGSTALSGTIGAGQTFYVAYEASGAGNAFNTVYGFDANIYMGSKFINGDDALVLLDTEYVGGSGALNAATVVDVYGVVGTDGSDESWEYQDTFAFRDPAITAANPTFTIGEWTNGAVNLFDGQDAAFHAANTSVVSAVPEPGSIAFISLGMLGLVARRRRS